MRKHYKIVSKPRFIMFLVICVLIIIYAATFISGAYAAEGDAKPSYVEICVNEGDTLWAIALEYGSDKTDVRRTIDHICQINSITASSLKPGDIILVPETL